MIIFAEILSGFAWAGFELTTFNYILETVTPEKRARGFAYFNMIFGFAVLAGGLLGSLLVLTIPERVDMTTIMIVFIISAVARLLVIVFFSGRIKEVRVSRQINENKLFFELIIAKPVNNALHSTTTGLLRTESDVKNLVNKTSDSFERFTDPVRPYVEEFVDIVDEELNKIEHIRFGLEPKVIKKHKKKIYSDLVNSKFNKKMSKHYTKKRRRK